LVGDGVYFGIGVENLIFFYFEDENFVIAVI
jgi:hypothetical protein